MSIHAERAASDAIKANSIETRPYPPSFIDKFVSWVEHLPIPFGVTYFALFLLEGSLNHLLSWADGWLPSYTLNPLILTYPLWLWGPLAIMTYLNLLARRFVYWFSLHRRVVNCAVHYSACHWALARQIKAVALDT